MSLLVFGAGLVLAGSAGAADRPIGFADFSYSPSDTTIKVKDTATFSGNFVRHPLIWDNGAFTDTRTGPSRTFTFSQPGNYTYLCEAHGASEGMVGVVRVVANQHPATVSFAVSASPRAGQPVTFTYTGSPDPDGTLTAWKWDLDGAARSRRPLRPGPPPRPTPPLAPSPCAWSRSTTAARTRLSPSRSWPSRPDPVRVGRGRAAPAPRAARTPPPHGRS